MVQVGELESRPLVPEQQQEGGGGDGGTALKEDELYAKVSVCVCMYVEGGNRIQCDK